MKHKLIHYYLVHITNLSMIIKKPTAKKIIQEISTILPYDINIMNENGIIIASTNPSRVDLFHEGAFKIIQEDLTELPVYYDNQYKGCRKGINLPIMMDDMIIGVIGMTGEVNEITKYGHILKKMTEIMVRDVFYIHQKNIQEQKVMFLIHDIINGANNYDKLFNQLKKHGFNATKPYTVFLCEPISIIDSFDFANILTTKLNNTGIGITQLSKEHLKKQLEMCAQKNPSARFYISNSQNNLEVIKGLFENAESTMDYLNHTQQNNGASLFYYEDFVSDIILFQIPSEQKFSCINKTFSACTQNEIKTYIEFIKIYSNCNGSINKIASDLFIHKNTVQYKINKIYTKTGLDMRSANDLFNLMLAVKLYESSKDSIITSELSCR